MKIDTKKCTSLMGSDDESSTILVNRNKFIVYENLSSTMKDHSSENINKKDQVNIEKTSDGRIIKYIPTIIYTPVLVSKRLEEKNGRRLLTSNDVDSLNNKLKEILQIVDDNNNKDDDGTKQKKIEKHERKNKNNKKIKNDNNNIMKNNAMIKTELITMLMNEFEEDTTKSKKNLKDNNDEETILLPKTIRVKYEESKESSLCDNDETTRKNDSSLWGRFYTSMFG